MNLRKFGNTELLVSEVGFGAWAIGGNAMIGDTAIGWGEADDATSRKAIHRALDLGVNFFDTADIYGMGHSEEMIGTTIGHRKDVVIATKVGNVAKNDQFTVDYAKNYILEACEASLKKLKRETIDYYQLHSAKLSHLQRGECIEAMQQLQKEGKVRYWGLSLSSLEPLPEAEFLLENNFGSGFQLVLNILNQTSLPIIRKAFASGYGIIARMPLQFGLLTGKFDLEAHFPEDDHRKNRLSLEIIETSKLSTEHLWQLCEKYNITKTQLALSYVLSYPEVSTVIPGIRTPRHVEENTKIIKLSSEDRNLIENTSFHEAMNLIRKLG